MENKGKENTTVSSLLMFKLEDNEGYARDLALGADLKGQMDGELGAGRKMRGELAYEVEEANTEWDFIFEPNVFGFGQAI